MKIYWARSVRHWARMARTARSSERSNGRDVLEYHAELEATLPPTPVRELLAASGATMFVLATDPTSWLRFGAPRTDIHCSSWKPGRSSRTPSSRAAAASRCSMRPLLGSRVGDRIAAPTPPMPIELVTLVAADRATAPEYVGLLSDGRIHRLLIKPAAVGAARLLIESATARRLQLREEHCEGRRRASSRLAPSRFPNWALAAAPPWARWRCSAPRSSATGSGGGADREASRRRAGLRRAGRARGGADAEEQVAARHAQAALARGEGRLAEPVGDSALDHYLAILALAPVGPGCP